MLTLYIAWIQYPDAFLHPSPQPSLHWYTLTVIQSPNNLQMIAGQFAEVEGKIWTYNVTQEKKTN